MPRTSCSLDQGNCSGNCAYQCVRWDDGVRGHLVEVFKRKIKSRTDDEHIETQALSSLLGRSRGQGFRHPDRTNFGICNHGPRPFQCCWEGRGGAGGDPKNFFVLAGKTIFVPPALKGPEAVIANSKVSSVSGGYVFCFDTLFLWST